MTAAEIIFLFFNGGAPIPGPLFPADPCDTFSVSPDPPLFFVSVDAGTFRVPGCG